MTNSALSSAIPHAQAELLAAYFPCWKDLSEAQRSTLLTSVHQRAYPKGAQLHNGSADCVGLLLVTSGRLRVYTVSDDGKELTLYRLFERDMCLFSASCIMPSIQFDVMVTAEQPSETFVIPPDIYHTLMEQSAPVANYTYALMTSHFSDVMWLMDQILNKKLDTRVAAFLIEESVLADGDTLTVTQEQIAAHLGSAREVVSRMLNYFQKEGLVELRRGEIHLLRRPALERLAGSSLR